VGIFVGTAMNTIISNNIVHDVPRACININDPFYGGHIIEFNRGYNCMKESADCGPFNTFGRTRFWSLVHNHQDDYHINGVPQAFPAGPVTLDALRTIHVRNNYFSWIDFPGRAHSSWVQNIDMDDGSSNLFVYDNVCEGAPIKVTAYGDNHVVTNNIIFEPNAPNIFFPMFNNSDAFVTNIVYSSAPATNYTFVWFAGHDSGIDIRRSALNMYYSAGVAPANYLVSYYGTDMSVKDWQTLKNLDVNSIFGEDPMFFNPKAGNFTLRPESPALKRLGFKNFAYGPQNIVGRVH